MHQQQAHDAEVVKMLRALTEAVALNGPVKLVVYWGMSEDEQPHGIERSNYRIAQAVGYNCHLACGESLQKVVCSAIDGCISFITEIKDVEAPPDTWYHYGSWCVTRDADPQTWPEARRRYFENTGMDLEQLRYDFRMQSERAQEAFDIWSLGQPLSPESLQMFSLRAKELIEKYFDVRVLEASDTRLTSLFPIGSTMSANERCLCLVKDFLACSTPDLDYESITDSTPIPTDEIAAENWQNLLNHFKEATQGVVDISLREISDLKTAGDLARLMERYLSGKQKSAA